jgi:hypothetical protein
LPPPPPPPQQQYRYQAPPPPAPVEPPVRKRRRGWKLVGSIVAALLISTVFVIVKAGVRETLDEDAHAPEVLLDYVLITDTPDLTAEADRIAAEVARDNNIARDRVAMGYYRLKTDPPASPARLLVAEAVGKVDVPKATAEFASAAAGEGFAAVQEYPADVPNGKIRCTTGKVETVEMSACLWISANHYVLVYFITGTLDEHRPVFVRIRAALAET